MNGEATERVVVVGGGVIGLAVGWELASAGRRVLLLERETAGAGSTGAAGGMLAPVSEAELEPETLIRFGRASLERYPEFVERLESESGVDCGYRTEGTLWVAVTQDDAEEMAHLETTLIERGLPVERLDAQALLRREPHLSGRVRGGLCLSGDHQIDPRKMTQALEAAFLARGGRIITGARVTEVVRQDGSVHGVVGRADDGPFEVRATQVVLAAGAWSEEGLRLPLPALGVRPVKGQLLRLFGPSILDHVVRTPDVYLIPRRGGELLVGATMEEVGFCSEPTAGAVLDLLRHAWDVLPGIYDLSLREVSIGHRSAVEDHLPVIGPTVVDGLWLALGHFRNGILLAPATAHHLARAMIDGRPREALEPFLPSRCAPAVTERVGEAARG